MPDDVFQVATGRGDTGRRADRRGRHDHVHRLDAHRPQGRRQRRPSADPVLAGARRQGPDDRPAPTPTSSAPRTPPSSTRCRTPARRASRSSASTSRRRSTTSSWPEGHREGAGTAPGRSTGPGTVEVGAMTFPPQLDIVERHVQDAVDKGAQRARRRRARPRGRERVLTSRPCSSTSTTRWTCMTEETFGPTLPIMKVADAEEAIRLANDCPVRPGRLGVLQGHRARRAVARRIEAGAVCVNDAIDQLLGARAADGRREVVGHRLAPRRRRDPQVHAPAGAADFPAASQEGPAHVPVHGEDDRAHRQAVRFLYGRGKRD